MDGFRDRMGRGSSDRFDRFDDSRYDRAERGRRSPYGGAPVSGGGISADEVASIVDESNEKQLNVISDLVEDTKDFVYNSEKNLHNSIDNLKSVVADLASKEPAAPAAPVVVPEQEKDDRPDEIIRLVRDNGDLLAQFAEEQLPMLVRGNSSMLSQISQSVSENAELIREVLNNSGNAASSPVAPVVPMNDNSEEVLQTVINNNSLLNALRAEVASIQGDIMREPAVKENDNGPLDAVPVTKEEVDFAMGEMQEHVHKECVKVYKNVQAALEQQNTIVSESVKQSTGGLKILVVFNLVLTVFNILFAVANALGLISF